MFEERDAYFKTNLLYKIMKRGIFVFILYTKQMTILFFNNFLWFLKRILISKTIKYMSKTKIFQIHIFYFNVKPKKT